MPEAHQRSGLISLVFFLLLSLLFCTPHFVNSEQLSSADVPESDLGNVEDEELFLANDQLYIQFYAKSPSSKMMFNQTTYQADFYTNVVWSQLTEGENRQFPIPSDFSFAKSHIPNPNGNGTLYQRVTFNATVNNGSVLMADVYLTNVAVNMTLTSSFNASVEPLLAPLDLPAPTQVPSRLLHASPEDNSLTLQLGPSSLLVKLRVMNWHYASTKNTLTMAGNVESSASGIDVFWSKYPPPTNNMATVGLPGGPKIIVVHLMNNATVGCDGVTKSIQSVYVDTRYDLRHILSPVSADIRLIFPSLHDTFHCVNATNHSVPCECKETFIDFVVYMELDKWETIVHWWLIAGIIVLALGAFAILICVFVCVARRYNRSLQEDKIKEREEKRARNERQSVNPAGATRVRGDEESSSGEEATAAQTEQRVWRRPDLTAEEETDPLLRFVYKKKTI
jgi:membrane protein implicated in regulation of membrane protease activity